MSAIHTANYTQYPSTLGAPHLRPPSPPVADVAEPRNPSIGDNAFARGTFAGCGAALASHYTVLNNALVGGMSAMGKVGVGAGVSTVCAGVAMAMQRQGTPAERKWNAVAAVITAGFGAAAACALSASVALATAGTLGHVGAYAALGVASGCLNHLLVHKPVLVGCAAAGAAAAAAVLLTVSPAASALAITTAAAVGVGAGASVFRSLEQFSEHATASVTAGAAFALAAALGYLAL